MHLVIALKGRNALPYVFNVQRTHAMLGDQPTSRERS